LSAQVIPDFSGVYLRDPAQRPPPGKAKISPELLFIEQAERLLDAGSPFILEVKQTPDHVLITAYQNEATASALYAFTRDRSIKEKSGDRKCEGRARFKKQKIVIESIKTRMPRRLHFGGRGVQTKETWELSRDRQTLMVRRSLPYPEIETYARQTDLASALRQAAADSLMRRCVSLRKPLVLGGRPIEEVNTALGLTGFRQFDRCVLFDAGFFGQFFKGLKQITNPDGIVFRRNGQPVSTFPDFVDLEVESRVGECPAWSRSLLLPSTPFSRIPAEFRQLRFSARWEGSVARDLGEIESELHTEPWTELSPPRKFYQMRIPSKDVQLQDSLVLRIFSEGGEQLGCISGHL
jgi:hypothetical protein